MMTLKELAELAEQRGATIDLSAKFFEFKEKGDGFCGRLKSFAPVSSGRSEGTYNHYLWDTDEGLTKCAFGSATDKELEPMLKLGNVYIVKYLGKVKISGGRTVNKFKISEIDEAALEGVNPPESKKK